MVVIDISLGIIGIFEHVNNLSGGAMVIESKQGDIELREWKLTDAPFLAEYINNIKVWNNVRDSLLYLYTLQNAEAYIRVA